MTLAPNHLLRSNGNNLLWLFLLIAILFTSCDAFRKASSTEEPVSRNEKENEKEELDEIQSNRRYNPKTGKYEYVKELNSELDTVRWTEVPAADNPPITSEGVDFNPGDGTVVDGTPGTAPGGQKLDVYNVAVLLPFLTNRFNSLDGKINDKSELALQFYSGAKIAMDELSQQGIQLKLDVVDTKASEDEIRRLIDGSALSDAHMIVGPVRSSNLKLVGEYARSNFKPLVSPISPSMSAASNNPYYIQVSPSLRAHCDAITRHAKERYRSDQIVLVCRNKKAEINRLRYFQQTNYMIEGSTLADRLTEFIVTDLSADFNEMDVAPYIKEGDTTVFVIPSWSNESFVYSFLRKVNLAKGNNQVVIYGMPQWMRFERISYDYFEQLNVHVSSANYVDQESPGIQRFRRSFFERYHMLPTENAYKGYDVMKFFGQMIHRYGTRFQDVIDQQTFTGANFQYKFERIPESDATPESGANIDHIENTSVDILKFEDYYFQPAY